MAGTKITYIPSAFNSEQVGHKLKESAEKATDNFENKYYTQMEIAIFICYFIPIAYLIAGAWIFSSEIKFITKGLWMWLFKRFYQNIPDQYYSVVEWLCSWFAVSVYLILSCVCFKSMRLLVQNIRKIYYEKGKVIPDKYWKKAEEIKDVYHNVDQFIQYINEHPNLTDLDFKMIGEEYLCQVIPHMDGDEDISFHFGPHLKEIIKDHTILDFSELDRIYGLLEN